ILVPEKIPLMYLAPEEIKCYVERHEDLDAGKKKPAAPLVLQVGSPLTINERQNVTEGGWTKRIQLSKSGTVSFSLPSDAGEFYLSISLMTPSPNMEKYNHGGILEKAKPFQMFLAAGVYEIKLGEYQGEGDYLPPCPSPGKRALRIVQSAGHQK